MQFLQDNAAAQVEQNLHRTIIVLEAFAAHKRKLLRLARHQNHTKPHQKSPYLRGHSPPVHPCFWMFGGPCGTVEQAKLRLLLQSKYLLQLLQDVPRTLKQHIANFTSCNFVYSPIDFAHCADLKICWGIEKRLWGNGANLQNLHRTRRAQRSPYSSRSKWIHTDCGGFQTLKFQEKSNLFCICCSETAQFQWSWFIENRKFNS